jgi:hypothetical protein
VIARVAALAVLVAVAIVTIGCGARSQLDAPEIDAAAPEVDAGQRSCAPDCTVGHLCCIGGCDGPPAKTLNDCCVCLAGEVSSFDCGGRCGGDD